MSRYVIITKIGDPIREAGRARLIWAAKTAETITHLLPANSVGLVGAEKSKKTLDRIFGRLSTHAPDRKYCNFYGLVSAKFTILSLRLPDLAFISPIKYLTSRFAKRLIHRKVITQATIVHTRDPEVVTLCIKNKKWVIFEDHNESFQKDNPLISPEVVKSQYFLGIIAIATFVRTRLVNAGIPPEKIIVQPSGVSRHQIIPAHTLKPFSVKKGLTAVYAGGLHQHRGIHYILDLAAIRTTDTFIIAGGRKGDILEFQQQAANRGLSNIVIEGYLDQRSLDRLLESADVLLAPYQSLEEIKITSPLKFFHYLAIGKPIVAARYPELASHFNDSLAVYWHEPGSAQAFVDAYTALLKNPPCLDQLRNNLNLAQAYSWETRAAAIVKHFEVKARITQTLPCGVTAAKNKYQDTKAEDLILYVNGKGLEPEMLPEKPATHVYECVFVMNINSKGWILDTICRQVAIPFGPNVCFVYTTSNNRLSCSLPLSKNYWFSHYQLLVTALKTKPQAWKSPCFVWFTHFKETKIPEHELISALNACKLIFCTCSEVRSSLLEMGIKAEKLRLHIGGFVKSAYSTRNRHARTIGFCGGYYERKNPELMAAIIKAMPDCSFSLLAPTPNSVSNPKIIWRDHYPGFNALVSLPNFTYIEAKYENYPKHYAEMAVFVSVSNLEGGPIPLLEAMASNCVPVVSHTGFAPDIIRHGINGFVFDHHDSIETIKAFIYKALLMKDTDVSSTVSAFDWSSFAHRIHADIAPHSPISTN
jgi:glycosyltransferase involved in cell wall biosynthesis